VEEIKPGKEVVLSAVVVACSSGLALMPSLIGPWLKHSRAYDPTASHVRRQTLCVVQNPSERSRHRYHYRQIQYQCVDYRCVSTEQVNVSNRMLCNKVKQIHGKKSGRIRES
jgi:hypothetical protein